VAKQASKRFEKLSQEVMQVQFRSFSCQIVKWAQALY